MITDADHERRKRVLGGSDATILAKGRLDDIIDLWKLKTGLKSPSKAFPSLAQLLGTATEQLNADYFEASTGRLVWGRSTNLTHPEHQWLGLSADGFTKSDDGRDAYLEFKFISWNKDLNRLYEERRYEFEALIRRRAWAEEVILPRIFDTYYAQCQHAMFVSGLEVAILCPIIGNEQYPREFEFDPEYWDALFDLEQRFWTFVELRIEPDESVMGGVSFERAG
jgi:predicted phage-related endonuclease